MLQTLADCQYYAGIKLSQKALYNSCGADNLYNRVSLQRL